MSTEEINEKFHKVIAERPEMLNSLIKEFFEEYLKELEKYENNFEVKRQTDLIAGICENLEGYELLKYNFVKFLKNMMVATYTPINSDIILEFLSNLKSFTYKIEINSNFNQSVRVSLDIIVREIFLYFIAFSLKNQNYSLIGDLLHSNYHFINPFFPSQENHYFVDFDNRGQIHTNDCLEGIFEEDNGSAYGKLLIKRLPPQLNETFLIDADLLCCYVSFLDYDKFSKDWFPFTYIFKKDLFEFFVKMTYYNFFEKVKVIFDVETKSDFEKKVKSSKNTDLGKKNVKLTKNQGNWVKPVEELVDLSKIASKK